MDENTALAAWRSVVGAARLEPMERVSNAIWRVIAEDGREWVLKHLPEFAPGGGPVEQFRVLSYLQARGLPVAAPVITDDGLIAFNADNLRPGEVEKQPTGKEAYALIPLLPNDSGLAESPELARTIGAGIGKLDRLLADCPWPVTSFTDDPAADLAAQYPRLPDEIRTLIDPIRDRLQAAAANLPTQRTHGDCNAGNVLVHNGQISGFIDFDHLPTGPRIYDLANYLSTRLRAHLEQGDPDSLISVLPEYIAGYQSSLPVSDRERAAVVPLMLAVSIGGANWDLHGWVPNPTNYQKNLRTIEWLAERYETLISAA
ncbi:MAG TPA: phosphotransferase [Mycobacteriales bacterium]|nr:phosphotransferase [Mycobacteriales bacterium]